MYMYMYMYMSIHTAKKYFPSFTISKNTDSSLHGFFCKDGNL